ncbi:MAG: chemotaxis protein CheW [Bacteroidales bacterium]
MNDFSHTATDQIIMFTLDELSFALTLNVVVKVIHAIEISYLPEAPEIIAGIINVKGQIIPVADIRKRFGLAPCEIELDDRLIITDTGKRQIAILVDAVTGIRDLTPQQLAIAANTLSFSENISGVAKLDDGLVLIYDLTRFLNLDEEKELSKALKTQNDGS